MKLTKSKLKRIIREELQKEWVNRGELEELPEPTGPGWGKKYHVTIPQGKLEVDDLEAAVETAKNWQDMGIEPDPKGTSPEVMEKLLSLSAERRRRMANQPPGADVPVTSSVPHYEYGMKYGGIKKVKE